VTVYPTKSHLAVNIQYHNDPPLDIDLEVPTTAKVVVSLDRNNSPQGSPKKPEYPHYCTIRTQTREEQWSEIISGLEYYLQYLQASRYYLTQK